MRSSPLFQRAAAGAASLALTCAAASAQSFNVDVGSVSQGSPSAAYGAGASQPGVWNAVDGFTIGTSFPLDDLSGASTGITVSYTITGNTTGNFFFNNGGTLGDDGLLMDDLLNVGDGASTSTWTFSGLTPGSVYEVYTYAWAPDSRTAYQSLVSVPGAVESDIGLGGVLWSGSQVNGRTFSRHQITVPGSGQVDVTVTPLLNFASINGFQFHEYTGCTPPLVYCTAKPNSLGCDAELSFAGEPSASNPSGFEVSFGPVPGQSIGIMIYTTDGALATPISGQFGFLCISTLKLFRLSGQLSGGTNLMTCDGRYFVDFNTHFDTQLPDANLVAGAQVDAQFWYRDQPNPGGANFSNAIQFFMCP